MPVRLYVGNLPKEPIERQSLQDLFDEDTQVMSTKIIKDRKTGKCRGFAFVTVSTDEAADEFIEKYNGQSFMDNPIKIEKALPRSKGKGKEEEAEGEETPTVTSKPSKKSNKKRARTPNNNTQSDAVQPDPRWADQLAQLKEMLAASSN